VYGLPLNGTRVFQRRVAKPGKAWLRAHVGMPLSRALAPLCAGLAAARQRCCCGRARKQPPRDEQQQAAQQGPVVGTLILPPVLPAAQPGQQQPQQQAGELRQRGAASTGGPGGSCTSKGPAASTGEGHGTAADTLQRGKDINDSAHAV
jgi:hypothetical protein